MAMMLQNFYIIISIIIDEDFFRRKMDLWARITTK